MVTDGFSTYYQGQENDDLHYIFWNYVRSRELEMPGLSVKSQGLEYEIHSPLDMLNSSLKNPDYVFLKQLLQLASGKKEYLINDCEIVHLRFNKP